MRTLLMVFVLFLMLQAEEEYELGKGVKLNNLPIYIGGYISFDYTKSDNATRYRLDDIALLAYGEYNKFSYLVELEFKEFYYKTYANNTSTTTSNNQLHIERMSLDYNFNDNYIFTLGKYYSPIGFWNLLPINVLRETTSNPISTKIIFPTYTTGILSSYSSFDSGGLKLDLMLQNNEDLDDDYNNYKIDKHYAIGSSYEKNDFTLKLNTGFFHKIDNQIIHDELYYLLLSTKYDKDKYQFLTEFGVQRSTKNFTTSKAGYIQGLYRFEEKHTGILRLESYKDNTNSIQENLAIFGYTYRPLYPVAIKSEFQLHSQSNLNQVLLSLSVLF